jgi:hypothetical protein
MNKKVYVFVVLSLLVIAVAGYSAGKETVGMKAHIEQGLDCNDCHETGNVVDSCLGCHANSNGTYRGELDPKGNGIEKEYPESGKTKMAAIHDSHGGPIRCTVCHTTHIESRPLYCNHCHQFNVKVK